VVVGVLVGLGSGWVVVVEREKIKKT